MEDLSQVEQAIVVRGERCSVTASLAKKMWQASGMLRGKLVEIRRAGSAEQAFEWWKNKAEMEPKG
jgi:hypothetical protein